MRVKNATEHSPVTVTCTGGDDLSVGEHTVTATALSNENYKLPDEGSKRTLTYTVAKGEETLPAADITMNGWTYGQTPTTPRAAQRSPPPTRPTRARTPSRSALGPTTPSTPSQSRSPSRPRR